MQTDNEAIQKAAAEAKARVDEYQSRMGNTVGAIGGCYERPDPLSKYSTVPLASRVRRGLEVAAEESWKLGLHKELQALIEKHPDTARMLDLIKILGY